MTDKKPTPEDSTEKVLHSFIHSIASEAQPLDGDVAEFVEEHFWDLISNKEENDKKGRNQGEDQTAGKRAAGD